MIVDSVKKEEKTISIKFKNTVLVEKVPHDCAIYVEGHSPLSRKERFDLSNIIENIPSLIVLYSPKGSALRWITIYKNSNIYVNSNRRFDLTVKILWETDEHRVERVLKEILGEKRLDA